MREYGQIQLRFWSNPDIQGLADQAKLLALYFLSGPHSNSLGCFRCPPGYIAEDLHWDLDIVQKHLDALRGIGFLEYDESLGWVFIPKFLKWNPPQNCNVGKGMSKLAENIPGNTTFYKSLIKAVKEYGLSRLNDDLINRMETVYQTVSKRFTKPYRTNEPEPEPDNKSLSSNEDKQGERPESSPDYRDEDLSAEQQGSRKHFSYHLGQYQEKLVTLLKKFGGNGRSGRINVYAFVQQKANEGNVHPKALIKILEQLDKDWTSIKNPWGWLETRFQTEEKNYNEKEFQVESTDFCKQWLQWSKSDEAKEILSHLRPRAP
ncbi:MAG: hypothetical protein JRI94_04290 [Deltaproteobacteria bacterium]|nr:hypothetical protein [Deltaproteobacteria bacterium]